MTDQPTQRIPVSEARELPGGGFIRPASEIQEERQLRILDAMSLINDLLAVEGPADGLNPTGRALDLLHGCLALYYWLPGPEARTSENVRIAVQRVRLSRVLDALRDGLRDGTAEQQFIAVKLCKEFGEIKPEEESK